MSQYRFRYLLTASLVLLCACDVDSTQLDLRTYGRVPIVEIDCDSSGCLGRWQNEAAWSPVYSWVSIATKPRIDPGVQWECEPYPDVDACVIVDQQGHKGCFRYESGWAVAVAPSCAISGDDWIDIGNDMIAKTTAYYYTGCDAGSLGCPCEVGLLCDSGLTCAVAENDNNVCVIAASTSPCNHTLTLDLPGIEYDDGCVAQCTQFIDHCGPMECSPKDAFAQGFCAWSS